MKKMICLLVLCCSIVELVCAQDREDQTNEDKTFELPAGKITRRFMVDLDKGNKMQIELTDIKVLAQIGNIDSLAGTFLESLAPLKDSLSDELQNKRIDYVIESASAKKIRIRQSRTNSSSYVVQQGEVAALRLEQDTCNMTGSAVVGKGGTAPAYRISFFLNSWNELSSYADGRLNAHLQQLRQKHNTNWVRGKDGQMHLAQDYTISAKLGGGYLNGTDDMLALTVAASIQNYKQYFAPSAVVGITITGSTIFANSNLRHELGIYYEPFFFFGKNSDGKLKTYRNDFITLAYGQGPRKKIGGKEPHMQLAASVSYLVHRSGDYLAPHTIRISTGRLSLFEGRARLEPVFYFNDFFKGVTPGIKFIQYF